MPRSTPSQVSCTTSSAMAWLVNEGLGETQHRIVVAANQGHERLLVA
jgi:hypothetical protein